MKYKEQYTEEQLIEAGRKALERERGELIDNCYRARIINSYTDVPYSTETLRKMYEEYWNRITPPKFEVGTF